MSTGNHDLTLDTAFFKEHGASKRKWPEPQDPEKCRRLLEESPTITHLENQAATIYLNSPNGPHTCFKVFGSPYSPNNRHWGFGYKTHDAWKLWKMIPSDADIVVTHTPPKGHCDAANNRDRSGCEVLLQALHRVRPMLSVFGHIHEARGVEIVQWNDDTPENGYGNLVARTEVWKDPGMGNNKQSLVNVSAKGGRRLNDSGTVPRNRDDFSLASNALIHGGGVQHAETTQVLQPGVPQSTSNLEGVADSAAEERAMSSDLSQHRQAASQTDVGWSPVVPDVESGSARRETVMINAAVLGPRVEGGARSTLFNKPIVVDIDLPVWRR